MNATNNNIKRKSKAAVPESWIYILGGILVSVVVYPFMDEMIPHREGPATLLTAGLTLAAAYFGRTWGQYMTAGKKNIHSGWIFFMVVLLVALVSWIFLVTQYPIGRKNGMNLFFLGLPLLISGMLVGLLTYILTNSIRKNLEQAKVTATQSQSELSLLHSQLSPHFLFNTLNNMYGISITNHEKLPALLLKLSELLRYSLYQVQDEFVPVKNEIAYLENYIEFERLRMGNRLQLTSAIEKFTDDDLKIAPMLLIVFVENAFKHSRNSTDENVYINMELKSWGKSFLFTIKNSYREEVIEVADTEPAIDKSRSSGLGLANVRKRLELLYPGEHDLIVDAKETEFNVMLQLKIR